MKHTIETVRKAFEDKGYVCLAKTWEPGYGATWKSLPAICVCGKEAMLSLRAVSRNSGCMECNRTRAGIKKGYAGRTKLTDEQVEQIFKEGGCELLESYKGCQTPMQYKCSCGNISKIRLDHFKNGIRCSKCKRGVKTSLEEAKRIFADNNCELLEEEYTNPNKKLKFRCKCGRVSCCKLSTMKHQKPHCRACGIEKNTGKNAPWYRKDREQYKNELRFKKRCYAILEHTLKLTKGRKSTSSHNLLGYTAEDFCDFVKSHKNWESVKDKKWHIDHIFPIAAFVEYGIKDIALINCLENLQPLCARQNSKKNKKYDRSKFEAWLTSKGIKLT